CDPGHYKWRTGSEACRVCPPYSDSSEPGAVECRCQNGYYRSLQDDKAMPCTKPPSDVRNLTVLYKDQSMINLTWYKPLDLGGRRDLYYRVECLDCGSLVTYKPGKTLTDTSLAWDPPNELHTDIDQYEIKYVMRSGSTGNHTYATRLNATVGSLSQETEYSFKRTPSPTKIVVFGRQNMILKLSGTWEGGNDLGHLANESSEVLFGYIR
ncbi:hypothetical protein LSH36_105g04022, partial [Paralvinella palmiformis]